MKLLTNRHEAAGALWNLSFDDKNREAIAAAGGIVALVWHSNCIENFIPIFILFINFHSSHFDAYNI